MLKKIIVEIDKKGHAGVVLVNMNKVEAFGYLEGIKAKIMFPSLTSSLDVEISKEKTEEDNG